MATVLSAFGMFLIDLSNMVMPATSMNGLGVVYPALENRFPLPAIGITRVSTGLSP